MDANQEQFTEADLEAALKSMQEKKEANPAGDYPTDEEFTLAELIADLEQLYVLIPSFEHRQAWAEQIRAAAIMGVSMHLEPESTH